MGARNRKDLPGVFASAFALCFLQPFVVAYAVRKVFLEAKAAGEGEGTAFIRCEPVLADLPWASLLLVGLSFRDAAPDLAPILHSFASSSHVL